MSRLSFTRKVLESKKRLYEITAKDSSGKDAWYLLEVPPQKRLEFERALKSGALKLDDYGVIVKSGFGPKPAGA